MISDLIQTLLHKRGIMEADAIEKFLKPDYARDVHDPFLLHDMERAVARFFCGDLAGCVFVVPQENVIVLA